MKRWLFNLAAGVSLAFCAAILALWVRSYVVCDYLHWPRKDADVVVYLPIGAVAYGFEQTPDRKYGGEFRYQALGSLDWVRARGATLDLIHFAGFAYAGRTARGTPLRFVQIPFWFLAMMTGIYPIIRLRRYRRDTATRRRLEGGLCQHCGYDLRATPDRCPECGEVARASSP